MKKKISATVGGVILFLIALLAATNDARGSEHAGDGLRITLGHTVANSHMTNGELSYEYKGMELGYTLIGKGDTKKGYQDYVDVYSLSHIVRPSWCVWGACNYYRLGVAYVDSSPLVGRTNFRLGVGLEWRHVQLEYFHYSSAGIHETNTGIDGIQLRYKIPL